MKTYKIIIFFLIITSTASHLLNAAVDNATVNNAVLLPKAQIETAPIATPPVQEKIEITNDKPAQAASTEKKEPEKVDEKAAPATEAQQLPKEEAPTHQPSSTDAQKTQDVPKSDSTTDKTTDDTTTEGSSSDSKSDSTTGIIGIGAGGAAAFVGAAALKTAISSALIGSTNFTGKKLRNTFYTDPKKEKFFHEQTTKNIATQEKLVLNQQVKAQSKIEQYKKTGDKLKVAQWESRLATSKKLDTNIKEQKRLLALNTKATTSIEEKQKNKLELIKLSNKVYKTEETRLNTRLNNYDEKKQSGTALTPAEQIKKKRNSSETQ